jgi:hypothetical protein
MSLAQLYLPTVPHRSNRQSSARRFLVSHVVTIKTRVQDAAAIAAACTRLGLPAPVHGTARLYSGEATGVVIQLPGWQYPAVIDTTSGEIRFDNFGGRWGAQEYLDRFLQMYAVELATQAARRKGYTVREEALQDGAIKLQIIEGS